MSSRSPGTSVGITGQVVRPRVVSIDIFRGLTMAMMIFVNDLSSVHGLSKWNYHIPANVDAMSYVDMVYPTFLFLVGMSLPLAVRQRLNKDPSPSRLYLHVLLRSLGLVVLGLILANAELGDQARMHINPNLWALLALLGAILSWMVCTSGENMRTRTIGRLSGITLLAVMLAIFRRRLSDGSEGWINFSYPEILGLIGLTYLAVCLIYLPLRRFSWAAPFGFVLMLLFNIACSAKWITHRPSMYLWPWDNGAMASIVFGGMIVSSIFFVQTRWPTTKQRFSAALLFALAALALGLVLRPLGISKIRATPTWSLWSIGADTLIYVALRWICDLRGWAAWAALFRPAGSNTLLTYLLPDIFYYVTALFGAGYVLGHWNAGLPGVARAVGFTVAMLLIAGLLTKARVRLQL